MLGFDVKGAPFYWRRKGACSDRPCSAWSERPIKTGLIIAAIGLLYRSSDAWCFSDR